MWYPGLVEPRFGAPKGQPVARGRSLTEFQKGFPDEAGCAAFLFKRRWPDGFVCPSCGGNRAAALKSSGIHLRVLWLRSSDFDHGGHGDAPHAAAADGVVLGRTFDGDTFQRHVGAAVGGSSAAPIRAREPRRPAERREAERPRPECARTAQAASKTAAKIKRLPLLATLNVDRPGTTQ